jgi:hypothetical protein
MTLTCDGKSGFCPLQNRFNSQQYSGDQRSQNEHQNPQHDERHQPEPGHASRLIASLSPSRNPCDLWAGRRWSWRIDRYETKVRRVNTRIVISVRRATRALVGVSPLPPKRRTCKPPVGMPTAVEAARVARNAFRATSGQATISSARPWHPQAVRRPRSKLIAMAIAKRPRRTVASHRAKAGMKPVSNAIPIPSSSHGSSEANGRTAKSGSSR